MHVLRMRPIWNGMTECFSSAVHRGQKRNSYLVNYIDRQQIQQAREQAVPPITGQTLKTLSKPFVVHVVHVQQWHHISVFGCRRWVKYFEAKFLDTGESVHGANIGWRSPKRGVAHLRASLSISIGAPPRQYCTHNVQCVHACVYRKECIGSRGSPFDLPTKQTNTRI